MVSRHFSKTTLKA